MSARLLCNQKGCQIAKTGLCLDGVEPPGECKHVVKTVAPPKAPPANSDQWRALPSGAILDFPQADRIMRAEPTRIILLAGPRDSGKTTLALSFYEQFRKGPFHGLNFAGSETLVDFERLCHQSRAASERSVPDTSRTALADGTRFLHLRVRPERGESRPRNLLFADLSGEFYEHACNNEKDCRSIEILRRADLVLLLLDGERIVQPGKGAEVLKSARGLLRMALDTEMLDEHSNVCVCFSKWDIVAAHEAARKHAQQMRALLARDFTERLASLRFQEVAARPTAPTGEIPNGFGLKALFEQMLPEDERAPVAPLRFPVPASDRQIDRYLAVTAPELCIPEKH